MGRWDEPDVTNGPLISQRQLDRVLGYIQSGKDEGAELILGGNRIDRPGFFVEPTIFGNCKNDMKIVRERIDGPVMSFMRFSDTDEVIELANENTYGLAGSVYSECARTCHKVALGVRSGTFGVNKHFMLDMHTPFGGVKQSGIGREFHKGLRNFQDQRTIMYNNN